MTISIAANQLPTKAFTLLSMLIIGLFLSLSLRSVLADTQAITTPTEQTHLNPVDSNHATFDHSENDTLFFSSPKGTTPPKPLKTGLFEINYLGSLQADEGGAPYLVLSAKPCQTCLDDRMIYVLRPTGGGKPVAFVYPGKILDPKNRALLLESRAFFGKCLPHRGDVYVVFQKERIDRRSALQPSVFIAETRKETFDETFLERHLPPIAATVKLVKRKLCHEITGRNRLMLSKPLDLHPHTDVNEDDEEDEDENDDAEEQS